MDDFIMLDDDFEPLGPAESNNSEFIDLSSIIDDSVKEEEIIGLDRLFNEDEVVIDVYEEKLQKEKIRQKRSFQAIWQENFFFIFF